MNRGVLTGAIMHKIEAEEILLKAEHESQSMGQKELEEEFLVTKTISSKEVHEDFENWAPSITAEYNQLVHTKEAVEQISKKALRHRAEQENKTIEILPAKMVYTQKAGVGARRSRAVRCGNYSETRFHGYCYAGGADGCQVRVLLRTAALKRWSVAATDIRVAFRNAPRREDGRLAAMEIPSVYRRLGLQGGRHLVGPPCNVWVDYIATGLVTIQGRHLAHDHLDSPSPRTRSEGLLHQDGR